MLHCNPQQFSCNTCPAADVCGVPQPERRRRENQKAISLLIAEMGMSEFEATLLVTHGQPLRGMA
ncbi:MAG: hypothetical protein DI628_03195 [Blastochloris viridis]|uniref:Uncharacterized protein n=1 Tax=Blastochloris viridis TaxID=1079 RepID=A0A6N4RD50_BLAVI|nr:MAG: hypothetical protein DI628_03195 [Blastochloris viridis]